MVVAGDNDTIGGIVRVLVTAIVGLHSYRRHILQIEEVSLKHMRRNATVCPIQRLP